MFWWQFPFCLGWIQIKRFASSIMACPLWEKCLRRLPTFTPVLGLKYSLSQHHVRNLAFNLRGLKVEVGKNINSSVHYSIFFPNSVSIQKIDTELIQASSGPRPPAVPPQTPLGPRLQQLEAPRPRVGGRGAAETPSELWRRVADVWRTSLSETVNSRWSWSHPCRCTACPWVALSSGERGGFSVNVLPPCV